MFAITISQFLFFFFFLAGYSAFLHLVARDAQLQVGVPKRGWGREAESTGFVFSCQPAPTWAWNASEALDPWGLKSPEGKIILPPSLGGTAPVLGGLRALLRASIMQTTRSALTALTPLVIFQVPILVWYSNDALQTFADMLCLFPWSSPYKMYFQAIVSNNLVSV